MSGSKRRKAMGSNPLAEAAPADSTAGPPPGEPVPPPEAAAGSSHGGPPPQPGRSVPEPERPATEPPGAAAEPPPLDLHVPPPPPLRPVPRRGALDPNDRLRTLAVALLMALLLAAGAQGMNRRAQLRERLATAEGRLAEVDGSVEGARGRVDRLSVILGRTEKELVQTQLLRAAAEATARSTRGALRGATATASNVGPLVDAVAAVEAELGFARRWPRDRRPAILTELERGDVLRLGRRARLAELNALRGEVRPETLQRLAEASRALSPWRGLEPDGSLSPQPSSPERGLLLRLLLDAGMNRTDLAVIVFKGASLRGQDLGTADLSGLDLRGTDLRGADLSRVHLDGARLGRAIFDDGTRWPLGFNRETALAP